MYSNGVELSNVQSELNWVQSRWEEFDKVQTVGVELDEMYSFKWSKGQMWQSLIGYVQSVGMELGEMY